MVKIAIASTVLAPVDTLRRFVTHHFDVGIEEIFFFLDRADDAALEAFADNPRVTTIPTDDAYWERHGGRPAILEERQKININQAAPLAREAGCHWLFHIDIDELLYPRESMAGVFADFPAADALRLAHYEVIPVVEEPPHIFALDAFKVLPSRFQAQLARLLGCQGAFYCGTYFNGHLLSKVAFRLDGSIPSYGIHGAHNPPHGSRYEIPTTDRIVLLHYNCVSYRDWAAKWERKLAGGMNPYFPERGKIQARDFLEAREAGESALIELFRRTNTLTPYQRRMLSLLGLHKRISLEIGRTPA